MQQKGSLCFKVNINIITFALSIGVNFYVDDLN